MLITLLHLLAGALLGHWAAALGQWPEAASLAAVVCAALAMMALGLRLARGALAQPAGALHWTGQAWMWAGDVPRPLARVVVCLDLGLWLLLRLHPADGVRPFWRCASAASAGPAWHGLRLALAAHAGAVPAGAPEAPR